MSSFLKRFFCLCLVLLLLGGFKAEAKIPKPCRKHANSDMKIALTFDDGPDKNVTEEILSILEQYSVKATFFVIGRNCEGNEDILKKISDSGHEIGNHTYSHPHLFKISEKKLNDEIVKTEELIEKATAKKPKLFRPPEGYYSEIVYRVSQDLGYRAILWSIDTLDWTVPKAEKISDTVMANVESGVIILCHDYVAGKSNTPAALRIFLPQLIQQGYEFVTVSELLLS